MTWGSDFGRSKRFFPSSEVSRPAWRHSIVPGFFLGGGGREKWLGRAFIAREETILISRF
jgi:hypothetical protein